jgi:hypothetical protein
MGTVLYNNNKRKFINFRSPFAAANGLIRSIVENSSGLQCLVNQPIACEEGEAVALPLNYDYQDEISEHSYSEDYEYKYLRYNKEKKESFRKNQGKFYGLLN